MRVLWFTTGPLPAVVHRAGRVSRGSHHWMSSLLQQIEGLPELSVSVATAVPGFRDDHFIENGVEYWVLGQPRFQSIFSCRDRDLAWAVELTRQWDPDVVHIHGSERFFGLMAARRLISNPVVISLQGFLQSCLEVFFGRLSPGEMWRSQRLIEFITRRGLFWRYREFEAGTEQEREILAGCSYFMGRTEWDRAVLASHNPAATYYHVGEVLRAPFRQARWELARCDRHTIVHTNAGGEARRATDVLLRALVLVRRRFPDCRLRLAGDLGTRRGYDRFLRRMIAERGLSNSVELLGYLDATAMAAELCRAHLFVHPSFVENSSNTMCEAMQVGLPCVANYVGGMPSLVNHGRTGWLVPPGDVPQLASVILRTFENDEAAIRLGRAARIEASERHAPDRVVSQLLATYNHVAGTVRTPSHARIVQLNRMVLPTLALPTSSNVC